MVMAGCSVFETLATVLIALKLPAFYVKLYIGPVVLGMGFLILLTLKRKFIFSWKKNTSLGLPAAFNKGNGGGGVITYVIFTDHTSDRHLVPSLVLGAILSVP